jgi:hypothetical protein
MFDAILLRSRGEQRDSQAHRAAHRWCDTDAALEGLPGVV